ncbi:hypothetical protein [Novosphingobium beihaiensis]|uniref:Uncharacterized protein n=1 Tax=Novosphingobium beihaiensis TaxID=2930389 RepID=A0ABT0BPV9_9SPHN|nr:hypothetical protein [Novosphingobium beihaiensis]MCJ2187028.1 hypothetical protein [Novosphingobium beihaiensis]
MGREQESMGCMMRDALVRFEEFQAASLHEREFVEIARVLKSLAGELGLQNDPVLDELANHGVGAALDLLCRASGSNVSGAYVRHRSR